MEKKLLVILFGCVLILSLIGCGTAYQKATNESSTTEGFAKGYFTTIAKWGGIRTYQIVYANDTKVKYFIFYDGYKGGISPLYNADGTLQVYDGE